MGKLLKYEFLKSKGVITVFFVVTGLIEVMFLSGNFLTQNVDSKYDLVNNLMAMLYGIGIIGYFCMLPLAALVLLIFAISIFSSDITKRQGYTVFLTPNSARTILASKLAVALISGIVVVIYFLLISVLNFQILFEQNENGNDFISMIFNLLKTAFDEGYGVTVVLGVFSMVAQWLANVMVIYFAIALTYTMLNNRKGRGIISFIMYCIISAAISSVTSISSLIVSYIVDIESMSMAETFNIVFPLALVLDLGIAIGFFFGTSSLIEKKLSM